MKNQTNTLFTIIALLSASVAFAQPNPPATPIDGGLGILLAGGVAYGVRKMSARYKKR